MTIRAVIFDFGGVFVDSPFAAAATAAEAIGVDPDVMMDIVFGSYDLDTDHAWHRLERGELSLEDAREQIMAASIEHGGPALDPFELLMALGGGGLRDDMVDFVRSARATGLAIASASALVDLDVVAVGGGFSHSAPDYLDLVRAAADEGFGFVRATRILPAGLGGEAPLIGAALVAAPVVG